MENSNVHFQKTRAKTVDYIAKFVLSVLFCTFLTVNASAQRGFAITFGLPYGIYTGDATSTLKPGTGIQMGLDFWAKNRKGHDWIAGVAYQSLKQKGEVTFNGRKEQQHEKYEYVQLRFMPLLWWLDGKKKFHAELGVFVHYLAQQETQIGALFFDYRDQTKAYYTGPCAGIGYKLGKEGDRNCLHVGVRDEFGALSFGKGNVDTRFNAISAYIGLGF